MRSNTKPDDPQNPYTQKLEEKPDSEKENSKKPVPENSTDSNREGNPNDPGPAGDYSR